MRITNSIITGILATLIITGCSKKEEAKQESPKIETHSQATTAAQQSSAFAVQQPAVEEHTAPSTDEVEHNENCTDCDHAQKNGTSISPEDKAVGTFTVEQLFAKRAELNGKIVETKGEVTKVSENIMGRSWIHIQDGTGAEGTNDIIFTSQTQTAVVGDKVTAKGVLAAGKDFGYGYKYEAIVESSVFIK